MRSAWLLRAYRFLNFVVAGKVIAMQENSTNAVKASEKSVAKKRKFKTIEVVYVGVFAALIAVCSWIQIPLTIPITLQTMGICIAAGLLGLKKGTFSVLVYILLGLVGVPVFAGFSAGPGVLFGVTGGYIIGFIFTALIVGGALKLFGKKTWVYIVSMIVGILVCYAFGTAWFMIVYTKNMGAITLGVALSKCVVPFLIPDLVKIIVATVLCKALDKHVKA